MKLLVLLTDGFGGRGGIAKFNRDLLSAMCLHPGVSQIIALPRVIVEDKGLLPDRLVYDTRAAGGKIQYVVQVGKLLTKRNAFTGIVCGHIHLLPLAAIAARWFRVPLILILHGVDAWQRPRVSGLDKSFRGVSAFVSVSRFTKQRFLEWAPMREDQGHVIPNCVDLSKYGPGPKPASLLLRYKLFGRRVIMTLARLSGLERYKGIDEILELMPSLIQEMPDLIYLIVGDGDDRSRLQEKAAMLGVENSVIFTGYIPEEEKADHYRLADVFAMPGRGEGFGIVYLEAMACGVTTIASTADASGEAVLDGLLGFVINPDKPQEIRAAIKEALNRPRNVQNELDYFSFERFVERWHSLMQRQFLQESSR